MAWSGKRKSIAAMACKSAGVTDRQRTDMILHNFPNAAYKGDITSNSPKLTNIDFEQFMAIVESYGGGQVMRYPAGHWHAAAADRWQRMRHHWRPCGSWPTSSTRRGI